MPNIQDSISSDFHIRVPLKLILFGEHLIFYNSQALALPLGNHFLGLTITPSQKLQLTSNTPLSTPQTQTLHQDISFVCTQLKIPLAPVNIHLQSSIPPGYGAGLSAAWSVGLVKWLAPDLDSKKQLELIQSLENQHHGTASGLDHHTIFTNSPTLYQPESKTFHPVPLLDSPHLDHLYLLHSHQPPADSTKKMVQIFQKNFDPQKNQLPENTIKDLAQSLLSPSDQPLKDFINHYGQILETNKVTPNDFQTGATRFRNHGGAIKICGGGAQTGGFGLALAYHNNEIMIKKIAQYLNAKYEKLF